MAFSNAIGQLYSGSLFFVSNYFDGGLCFDTSVSLVSSVVSDPFFTGFWGQQFTVTGTPGAVYSILSDRFVQVSALFTWLTSIDCPLQSNGAVMDGCFNHTGTYFGAMSLSSGAGDVVVIEAGGSRRGFASVAVNGEQLQVGQSYGNASHSARPHALVRALTAPSSHARSSLYVRRLSSHSLTVHASVYEMRIDNADAYVDLQAVRVRCQKCVMDELRPEGLLGRTWNISTGEPSGEGVVEQYREKEGRLTGCAFTTQRFCHQQQHEEQH